MMKTEKLILTRRDALRLLGASLGGVGLTACGVGNLGISSSPTSSMTHPPIRMATDTPLPTETLTPSPVPTQTPLPRTLRNLADAVGLRMAVLPMPSRLAKQAYRDATLQIGNELIGDDLSCHLVYQDVNWPEILSNWDLVQDTFNRGQVSYEHQIRWDPWNRRQGYMAGFVDLAADNKMSLCVDSLLWSTDVPESILQGGFSREELRRIAEFMLKNTLLKFKDVVREWSVISESPARYLWGDWRTAFWERNLGYPDIVYDAFRWARAVAPDAHLNLIEDGIDATDDARERTLKTTLDLLDSMKRNDVPADGFSFENNLWIYAPPKWDEVHDVLGRIRSMGYSIGHSQTTVVLSEVWPIYPTRARTVWEVPDKLTTQAEIYSNLLEAYLDVDGDFGVFGVTDADSWYQELGADDADPLLFNRDCQPKPCYEALLLVLEARLKP